MARSCSTTAYVWLSLDSLPSLRTLWSAVVKSANFSARGKASPVRLLQEAFVTLVLKQTWQFRSFGERVKILCSLDFDARIECSESESWEMCARAGTSVGIRLSGKSCNQKGISANGSLFKTEADDLGIKKPPKRKANLFYRFGSFEQPVNQKLDQSSVSRGTGKPPRDSSQNPTTHSQALQQDGNPFRGARKLVRSGVCERPGNTGKLVRGIDNLLERTRVEYHKMHISDYRCVERVFKNLRQKLNLSEDAQVLDLKTNVLIWGLFMSTTMKAAVHLRQNYTEKVEHKLRGFDVTQRLILDHKPKYWMYLRLIGQFPPWTRSSLVHDQVIKWIRLLFMSGKDVWTFRGEQKNWQINS